MRVLIGAFGDPGHAFPAIALGRELTARGHEVMIQTWQKWQQNCLDEGMRFSAAPEYHVFPTRERPMKPYEAAARAATETRPVIAEFEPDVVVNDILTLAPALAAELEGRRRATLVPHFYPPPATDVPPYGLGAMPPRSLPGKWMWRLLWTQMNKGVDRGRQELNETRKRLGLAPTPHSYGGMSRELTLVATYPQLEYPRAWPGHVEVVGPLFWEQPFDDVEPPPGTQPLVLVAPSTSQDPQQTLLRYALEGLADLPVRVLATENRRPPPEPIAVPANAKLVDWVAYSQTMQLADVVVCHGGHGTMARALSFGKPVVIVPAAGDMAENGTRVSWAGVGVSVPGRLASATTLRWAVQRVLERPQLSQRATELGRWSDANPGNSRAAELVERVFGQSPQRGTPTSAASASPRS